MVVNTKESRSQKDIKGIYEEVTMWTGLLKGLLHEIPSDIEILTLHMHLGGDKKKKQEKNCAE